ncbi:MAG TPA: hypothetical protein VNK03_07340 [Gammaproteobacteria bacterium]|nr:hypothetical protein [Gammaproteobacteria bacterium]
MYNQDDIEDAFNEAPLAPPLAPDFDAPILTTIAQNNDSKVIEILKGTNPRKIQEKFEEYKNFLNKEYKNLFDTIEAFKTLRNLSVGKKKEYDIFLKSIQEKIINFEQKINLLPEMTQISKVEMENISALLGEKLKQLRIDQERAIKAKKQLELEIPEKDREIERLSECLTELQSKKTALSRSITRAQEEGLSATSTQLQVKRARELSPYEAEIINKASDFIRVRSKPGMVDVYQAKEIFALQCAIFDWSDWDSEDLEQMLENKLRFAISMGKLDVKGIGATPRESIQTILGYDIVNSYKARQDQADFEKKALEKQRKEAARKERDLLALENKNVQETIEDSNNLDIAQPSGTKRARSPENIDFVRQLAAKQQAFQREREAKLAAEAAQLKAEEQARLKEEEAQRFREEAKKEKEERDRAEAQLLKAQSSHQVRSGILSPNARAKAFSQTRKRF